LQEITLEARKNYSVKLILLLIFLVTALSIFAGFEQGQRLLFGLSLAIIASISLFKIVKRYGVDRLITYGVFFVAIYFPFEEVVLKLLPVSSKIYSILRFGGEFFIYALFLAVLIEKFSKRSFIGTPIDIALFLFVAATAISALVNNTGLIEFALFMRAILRYVTLFYTVANLKLSNDFVRKLVIALICVGLIQVAIGFAQVTIGERVNNVLKPRESTLTVAGYSKSFILNNNKREIGSIYGTTGDTINLALFLMVTLSFSAGYIFFAKPSHRLWLALTSFSFILAIIFTYSRGTFLSVVLLLAIILLVRRKKLFLAGISVAILLILSLVPASLMIADNYREPSESRQSPIADFTHIFTNRYKNSAQKGRLYVLNVASNEVITKSPVFGFGPEFGAGKIELLRDVYWIFIMYKVGLLGIGAFVFLFIKLGQITWYVYSRSEQLIPKMVALSFLAILGAVVLDNFFISVSEIKIASLYFWLFAGLLAAYWNDVKSNKLESSLKGSE